MNDQQNGQTKTQTNQRAVYTIIEREHGDNIWVRIGVGWVNRDGSLNITLSALPVNGKLHIREERNGD